MVVSKDNKVCLNCVPRKKIFSSFKLKNSNGISGELEGKDDNKQMLYFVAGIQISSLPPSLKAESF